LPYHIWLMEKPSEARKLESSAGNVDRTAAGTRRRKSRACISG